MLDVFLKVTSKFGPYILKNKDHLVRMFQTKILYRNQKVRLSVSYLFRIKIDNKYLLVKSKRIENQYQPVGGVFKVFSEANKFFNEIGVETDFGYNFDDDIKDDLRLLVPGKNVMKFLNWLNKEEDREVNPTREFREELIETGVLPEQEFSFLNFHLIKKFIEPIKFSTHFQCNEIHIRYIYQIKLNEKQENELRKIFDKETDYYRWFDINEIKSKRTSDRKKEFRVGDHTLHII